VAARPARPARSAPDPAASSKAAPSRSGSGSRPTPRGRPRVKPVRAFVPVLAGLAWALLLLGAVAVSSFLTVVVMVPIAALAVVTGIRATESKRRKRSSQPSPLILAALAVCVLDPLIALGGMLIGVAALVLSAAGLTALVVVSVFQASARPVRTAAVRLVAAITPTLAVTGVVLARHQGSSLALVMVAAALAFDIGAFLMGNSRTPLGGPVGVAFGVISVAVVALFAAAVMGPPMSGARPWVVFAVVAVAAPAGVRLCQWPAGGERLPALRRLDSLSVVAPVWVVLAAFVLHR
jgi:hypothetical protein